MAKYSFDTISDKKVKFIKRKNENIGHIVLRSQKSERNVAKAKALKSKSGGKHHPAFSSWKEEESERIAMHKASNKDSRKY